MAFFQSNVNFGWSLHRSYWTILYLTVQVQVTYSRPMHFTEQLRTYYVGGLYCIFVVPMINMQVPMCSAVGTRASVATHSCWCKSKVYVHYWRLWICKTVLQRCQQSCLTHPTITLSPNSPVMLLILVHTCFKLPQLFFILVPSH